jgi:hypothetical protein
MTHGNISIVVILLSVRRVNSINSSLQTYTHELYAESRGSWASDALDITTGRDPRLSWPRNHKLLYEHQLLSTA